MASQMEGIPIFLAVALSWPFIALAQQTPNSTPSTEPPSIPEVVTGKLANDLATLQREVQTAARPPVAPSPETYKVVVTRDRAPVLEGADASAPKSFTATKGQELHVLDRANGFFAIATDNGETGWITSADVKPTMSVPAHKGGVIINWVGPDDRWNSQTGEWESPGKFWDMTRTGYDPNDRAVPPDNNASSDRIFKVITEKVVTFRDSYKNNAYVQVSGFTIHLAVLPSVDLTFTFK